MLHQHLSSIRPYSREDTGSSVLQSEILIIKRSTIDGLPSAIVEIKDRTLTQRTWYDTSESRSLVADSFISCEVDRVIICSDGVQIEGEKSNESASTIMQQPRQEKERETHQYKVHESSQLSSGRHRHEGPFRCDRQACHQWRYQRSRRG